MHLLQQPSEVVSQYAGHDQPQVIVCSNCQISCPVAGRTDNDIYAICRCGNYIQIADRAEE